MFIVVMVFFLLPCSLLWTAWKHSVRYAGETKIPTWRAYCGHAALILAVASTLLELMFFFSWFHNGGSPHGMMPSSGVWRFVGRISFWALIGSVLLSAFGKGKWRLFVPAWAASYLLIVYVTFMLERD
jgi:hypothetical protein